MLPFEGEGAEVTARSAQDPAGQRPPSASTGPSTLGQRVKVMAGVTNDGAGGQRVHIQEGTGNWAVGRVSQTVHIRGEVIECDCLITDLFDRTEIAAWGESTSLFVWEIGAGDTASQFSVADGWGVMISDPSAADSNISLPVGNPSPDPIVVTFQFREAQDLGEDDLSQWQGYFYDVNDNYWGVAMETIEGDPEGGFFGVTSETGDTNLASDPFYVRGDIFNVKLQILGKQVSGKLWALGDPEPVDWLAQAGDPDATHAPMSYWDFSATNFGVTLSVREFSIEGIDACLFDNFARTETGDWGDTTPTGVTWAITYQDDVTLSVAGDVGVMEFLQDGEIDHRLAASPPWLGSDGFVMGYDFLTGAIPSGLELVSQDWEDEHDRFDLFITISSGVEGKVGVGSGGSHGTADIATKTDWIADTWYRVKCEYRPGGVIRAKVWPRDDAEPAGWLVSFAAGATLSGYFESVTINNTLGDYTLAIDNITFNSCPAT